MVSPSQGPCNGGGRPGSPSPVTHPELRELALSRRPEELGEASDLTGGARCVPSSDRDAPRRYGSRALKGPLGLRNGGQVAGISRARPGGLHQPAEQRSVRCPKAGRKGEVRNGATEVSVKREEKQEETKFIWFG